MGLTPTHPISLAAGNLPEFKPAAIYRAAVESEFDLSGMWVDQDTWTQQTTRELRTALSQSSVPILDVEVLWIHQGDQVDHLKQIIDVGAELEARYALVVSSDPSPDGSKRGFETLCRHSEGTGLQVVLEFLPITAIKSFSQAMDVVSAVGHPNGKILIDTLHLSRSGSSLADVSAAGRELFPYLQIADAPAECSEPNQEHLLAEAVNQRLLPGEGALPIKEVIGLLSPGLPISPEIRSAALRAKYPNPTERAAAILKQTRDFLLGKD